jgi:hypothetical protein
MTLRGVIAFAVWMAALTAPVWLGYLYYWWKYERKDQ